MDLVMPTYDGFYGIEKIRTYDPKSKIMIISASLTHLYVKKLLKLNVNAILLKPYDLNNIIEKIDKVHRGVEFQKVPVTFQK
jgi:YesN/AraC family two-component response regulator